jgi:hypothetical protein
VTCEAGYVASGGACVASTPASADACPGVDVVPGGGTVTINAAAFRTAADVGTACGSRGSTGTWIDWVAHFTLAATQDVTVTMTGGTSSTRMQLQASCSATAPQIGPCVTGATIVRRYLSLPPGDYYVVGENPSALTVPIQIRVDPATATPRATGDVCPGLDVTPDGALATLNPSAFVTTSDLGTVCGSGRPSDGFVDWVYHFRTTSTRDVTLNLTNVTSSTVMQLQTSCGASPPLGGCMGSSGTSIVRRYRALAPGDYYVVVEASSSSVPTAASLGVTTTAPGARTPGDACSVPISVPTTGAPTTIPLSGFDGTPDHGTPCGSGTIGGAAWVDWAFTYTLTSERDVSITVTPSTGTALYGLVETACGVASTATGACSATSGTPWVRRISRQPAGTYYVVGETRTAPSSLNVTVEALPAGTTPTYLQGTPPSAVVWVDACAAAGHTEYLAGADDGSARVALPFAFRYWGLGVASGAMINITSNGWIGMDGASSAALGGTVPSATAPNAVVAPFWGDNYNRRAQCVALVGAAPDRRWVVEWNDSHYCCTDDPAIHLSYEVVLTETSNTIDFLYDTMMGVRAQTVGLENQDGTLGVNACGAAATCAPATGTRIRFTPSP